MHSISDLGPVISGSYNKPLQTCAVGGFISNALTMGHGIYNFIKTQFLIIRSFLERMKNKNLSTEEQEQILDDLQRNELFLRERIPIWLACVGYIFLSVISIVVIPLMFPEMKWYYVVVAYLLAPPLGFCNAYIHGAGLTDMNMAYNYGKVALFVIAAIAGKDSGVVAPPIFFLFYKAFDIGNSNGEYKAPYALIYRNMAILGVEGFSALPQPQYCLQLCYAFFGFAVIANLVRDLAPKRIGKWVPLPTAMAVPFLVGASFAIDMCVGSLVVFIWHKINSEDAKLMVPVTASGLICGEGLWILPSSILALAKFEPPICMMFSKPSR